MSATSIEWTDSTWNPLAGCSLKSPGCSHCYAEVMAKRLQAMARADLASGRDPGRKRAYLNVIGPDGKWNGRVETLPEALEEPLRRRKPTRWFVNSMSDLFWGDENDLKYARHCGVEDPQPVPFEFIDRVFAVMASTGGHTYQILTKRPARMLEYLRRVEAGAAEAAAGYRRRQDEYRARYWDPETARYYGEGGPSGPPTPELRFIYDSATLQENRVPPPVGTGRDGFSGGDFHWREWPLSNVWLGVSCERQQEADERIPLLLQTPASVRFLSCEPLLGAIDLGRYLWDTNRDEDGHLYDSGPLGGLHWVIAGGESGPGARPCDLAWISNLVEQCRSAGVACFVKQLGAVPVMDEREWRSLDRTPLLRAANAGKVPAGQVPLSLGDKKGGDPEFWPEFLRVREFPEARP